jgi:hypothetical protein
VKKCRAACLPGKAKVRRRKASNDHARLTLRRPRRIVADMTEHIPFATGGCACGAVRYTLADQPYAVNCCHCTDCQREVGSAFAVNAAIETPLVQVTGAEPVAIHLASASGAGQTVMRCPRCQTALFSHYGALGTKAAFVRAGTLDNPALCPPTAQIWTRSRLPWVALDPAIPAFEAFYSGRDIPALLGERGAERLRSLRKG